MYLIISGTGGVGGAVARALLADRKPVRVLTRRPELGESLRHLGAEVVSGDLREPLSLARACQGVEKVLAAAHSLAGGYRNSSRMVDDVGNHHLIDAAWAEGVQHFVFISARGARPDHPVDFFRHKYAVEEYLRAGKLSHTILRPSPTMETWAAQIGRPIIERGRATIVGGGENPINFIAEYDLVRYALIGLDRPEARGQTLEVGGPENLGLNQVVALYERELGVKAKVRHIPARLVLAAAELLQPFSPGTSRLMRVSALMDLAGMAFDPAATLEKFPMRLMRLEEVVRTSVATAGRLRPGSADV